MTVDRILIICSIAELTFIILSGGVTSLTCFQWVTVILLIIKFTLQLSKTDRILITCSVVELTFTALNEGVAHFTLFQWAMVTLLAIKLALVVAELVDRTGDDDDSSTDAD